MRVTATKHLEAGTPITPVMMLLKRTRTDSTTIQCHITTDHLHHILRLAPRSNTAAPTVSRPMACHWLRNRCRDLHRRPIDTLIRHHYPLNMRNRPGATFHHRFTYRYPLPAGRPSENRIPAATLPMQTQRQPDQRPRPTRCQ